MRYTFSTEYPRAMYSDNGPQLKLAGKLSEAPWQNEVSEVSER